MYSTMTKGRPFSIYCIILFLCTEARRKNHILLQRGIYLSQKWRQTSLLAFQKPSDGYPIIECNHNHITKPTKTQIRTHLQKVCVRIFQYGAQLATGPREANASACATHEPAPKGMVHPLFRPIRPWRDLRSKNGPLHRFALRHAGRHIRIMGKGMKVRAVPILPATAKNEKIAANRKLAAGN